MNILGISAFYHDSAACLIQDGSVIAAAQEERFTRKKQDAAFPEHAINYCLEEKKITPQDIDYVAFYEKPFLKFERILSSYMEYAPLGIRSFLKAMPQWIKQKLWIKNLITSSLNFDKIIIFPEHHESHAASAFFPSPFQEAAFLTVDGVGEWATASYGIGKDNSLKILAEMNFPHSLGLLYSAFTYYTGFKVNSGEYKMMGLAPYGTARYKDLILKELIDLKADGSFHLNLKYFNFCTGLTMITKKFEQLFGAPARVPESPLTQKYMDIARSIQEVTEEILLRMANHVYNETKQDYLCLAGGVALNCVSNGNLLKNGPFKDIWIQPAAGDAGAALGAAFFTWYQYLGNKRSVKKNEDSQKGSLLGPSFDNKTLYTYITSRNLPFTELPFSQIPDRISTLIAQQKIIGWFQGRMEFGPRALGNRSILGDPRSAKMQEVMNLKIKFRESFRPFAPSILEEHVSNYFNLNRKSPYMLLVAKVNEPHIEILLQEIENYQGTEKLKHIVSRIPAVTHVDYTARIQTVNKNVNPLYYQLLKSFYENYSCPVLINTSFNVRGEPIVCTPEDAYLCFMRTNIDYLLLGPYLLDKKEQKPLPKDINWGKTYTLD